MDAVLYLATSPKLPEMSQRQTWQKTVQFIMLLCSFKTLLFAVANPLEIIATYVFHLSICTNMYYILQNIGIYWLFYLVHEYLLSSPRQGLYFVYLYVSKHPASRS